MEIWGDVTWSGMMCRSREVDGDEIEVNVTWSSEANTELQVNIAEIGKH